MALQYNLSKVFEISASDTAFVNQVVVLFLEEMPLEIKSIKMGIQVKDYARVYASAHKIKPSLDLLGMDLAYDENLEVMKWAKAKGKKKEIKEIFKLLQERVKLAVKELRKDFKTT